MQFTPAVPTALLRPKIGKVSMVYSGLEAEAFEKVLELYEENSRRYNYPMFILRTPILDSVWNKPLNLLSTIIKELSKPED